MAAPITPPPKDEKHSPCIVRTPAPSLTGSPNLPALNLAQQPSGMPDIKHRDRPTPLSAPPPNRTCPPSAPRSQPRSSLRSSPGPSPAAARQRIHRREQSRAKPGQPYAHITGILSSSTISGSTSKCTNPQSSISTEDSDVEPDTSILDESHYARLRPGSPDWVASRELDAGFAALRAQAAAKAAAAAARKDEDMAGKKI